MEYVIICLVALLGSGLTLFSGFGLGTLLVPVFGLFFPIELAIALTAIVHFLNNIFKLLLLGKKAHLNTVLKFGIPSVLAAFLGALLLASVSQFPSLLDYTLFNHNYSILPVKLTIAVLLIFFSFIELVPALSTLTFSSRYLPLGGLLSGFFGGLSGNQGALRSAFLIRTGLDKEQYIATGVVIACLIDVSRLSVYSTSLFDTVNMHSLPLLVSASLSAFAGAYFGNKLLKKITVKTVQYFVSVALALFGILLGAGII